MNSPSDESEDSPNEQSGESAASRIKNYVHEAHAKIPELGKGRRWYDLPYMFSSWLQYSWPKKVLPRRWRLGLNRVSNYLIPFHRHDLNKVWSLDDELHNLHVPAEEHVAVPGLWVVELFPPSEVEALSRTIAENAWDRRQVEFGLRESNSEMLQRSRGGQGWAWWRLAEIADIDSTSWFPDGTRERLPRQFESIELTAVQIGSGLTAIVGYFRLTADGSKRLDEVWHQPHEPQLVRGVGRRRALDRMWSGLRSTQLARREHQDAARRWLADRCPGFFAANNENQTLIDLLLLEQYEPTSAIERDRAFSDALRGLGLTDYTVFHRTAPQLPKMLLSADDTSLCPDLSNRAWALWGNRDAIVEARKDLESSGQDANQSIAYRVHESIRNYLVQVAVSDFLTVAEKRLAESRDSARTRHGQFRARDLRQLRTSFLTISLDLTSTAEDVRAFGDGRRYAEDAQFFLDHSPWIVQANEKEGRKQLGPIDLNEDLRKSHEKGFRQLIQFDRDYRDILSTVSSLGASMDASRVGRIALGVALVSSIVALATMLVTDVGPDSAFEAISDWFVDVLGI